MGAKNYTSNRLEQWVEKEGEGGRGKRSLGRAKINSRNEKDGVKKSAGLSTWHDEKLASPGKRKNKEREVCIEALGSRGEHKEARKGS